MNKYDRLPKKKQNKANSFMLYSILYNIGLLGIIFFIVSLFVICILLVSEGSLRYALYALLFYGVLIIIYAMMRVYIRETKQKMIDYFGFDNLKEIFEEE